MSKKAHDARTKTLMRRGTETVRRRDVQEEDMKKHPRTALRKANHE